MKKSNIVMTALGAAGIYAGRRIARKLTSVVTGSAADIFTNTLFHRIKVGDFVEMELVKSPLVKDIAPYFLNDRPIEPSWNWTAGEYVGRFISIGGFPCYLPEPERGMSRVLYVPKVVFPRIRGILDQLFNAPLVVKKRDVNESLKHTWNSLNDQGAWQASVIRRHAFLDDIPIATATRAKLQSHIDRVDHEWRHGDVYYSRNLLLYGPKGGGKSNISMAIANELKSILVIFPVCDRTDGFLDAIERSYSKHTVVLMDEAEALPVFRPNYQPADNTKLSTRDLLDYFSGIGSPQATMTILCTNDPDKIDERFRRKGRFKEEILIDKVDSDGIKYWLKKRYDYTAPEAVRLRPTMCADLFDMIDTLDDPEALVRHLTIRPRTRKPKTNPTPK